MLLVRAKFAPSGRQIRVFRQNATEREKKEGYLAEGAVMSELFSVR